MYKILLLVALSCQISCFKIIIDTCIDKNNNAINLKFYEKGFRRQEIDIADERFAGVDIDIDSKKATMYWYRLQKNYELWFQTIPTDGKDVKYFRVQKEKPFRINFIVEFDQLAPGQSRLTTKQISEKIGDFCLEFYHFFDGKGFKEVMFCCDYEASVRTLL